jgi:hypothetical protein
MFFLKPFNIKATRGESGNMLLITGMIASAIAVAGGKVMLDRSTAQRKANQMSENMKRAKEIPGSAAMVAKALISLPGDVAKSKVTSWTTENISRSPKTVLPILYPVPYVQGRIGGPAQPATVVVARESPPDGANWGEFKPGSASASVVVYTNDSTRASASHVSDVLGKANTDTGAKKIVGGSDTIKRTKSTVTYKFRNCDGSGKTSAAFTGIYCASAEIASDNYASASKGGGDSVGVNRAIAELGMIEPPPPPTCEANAAKKITPAVVRPGEAFSIDFEASGVVVGYEVIYAGQCLYDSTGGNCKVNGKDLKSYPWNLPHKAATHTMSNIPTSGITSKLGELIAANQNQATFDVKLIGIGGSKTVCSATVNLPGPVSCLANSLEVTRTGTDSRKCEVTLRKDQGEGSVKKIFVQGTKQTEDCYPDRLPGDVNLDGRVNSFDLVAIQTGGKFNAGGGNAQWSHGDFNCDGKVDAIDLVIASSNYGVTRQAAGVTDEDLMFNQEKPVFDGVDSWKSSSFACEEDPFSFSAWFERDVHGVISKSYCSPVYELSELGPSCAGVVSYDRTPDGMCILKVSRTSKSHSKLAIITGDGKFEDLVKPGSWSGLEWTSEKFSCSPFPHTITPELSKVTVNGVRQTTGQDGRPSCGSSNINNSANLCVPNSMKVTPNPSKPGMCVMSVYKESFVKPEHVREVRRNFVKVDGSWNGALWTSNEFLCADGGNFVGQLVGADNRTYECGTHTIRPLPPACDSLFAERQTPTSTTCNVKITKGALSGPIGQVLVNGSVGSGSWSGNIWRGTTTCPASSVDIGGRLISTDTVTKSICSTTTVPPAESPVCSLEVSRVGDTNNCLLTASSTGSSLISLFRDGVEVPRVTWTRDVSGADKYTVTTSCPTVKDTRFDILSKVGSTDRKCKQGIRRWYRSIGNGEPHHFAKEAIPGRPICPPSGCSIRCEGSTWRGIARAQGFNNYVDSGWRSMCRHRDGRYNYTSCGDNRHQDWNGERWVSIPACSDSWTTYLTIYNPIPANFTPP